MKKSRHKVHFEVQAASGPFVVGGMQFSPFMRLSSNTTALRTYGASCFWCKKCPPLISVKTGRVPSRHCRDARVDAHTTTAMNGIEYAPPTTPTPELSHDATIPRAY